MQLQITSKPHCVKLTVQSQYVRHWDFLSRSNFGKLKKAKQIKQKKTTTKIPTFIRGLIKKYKDNVSIIYFS